MASGSKENSSQSKIENGFAIVSLYITFIVVVDTNVIEI